MLPNIVSTVKVILVGMMCAAVLTVLQPPAAAAALLPEELTEAVVTKVIDGDTIAVRIGTTAVTVRLIGIDTPEVVDPRKPVQCFGREASARMQSLVGGATIYLEADASQGDRDKYNRILRYVWLADGTHVNNRMVTDGYAFEYTYAIPYRYQTLFRDAQRAARSAQRGLWSPVTCNGVVTTPVATVSRTPSRTRTSVATRTPSQTRSATRTPTASRTAIATPTGIITAASAPCVVNSIKGNTRSLIYHVPSGAYYATTHVSVRCFVTESEAIAAGYRRSSR